jgi:LysM repeat protein
MRRAVLIVLLFTVGCIPVAGTQTPHSSTLQIYSTSTPKATPAPPTALVGPAPSSLLSPTPFTYTIKAGDTLGAIADKFSVNLDALLAANPGVNPNGMRIGDKLKIPSDQKNPTGESTPTPAPFSIVQMGCRPTADAGLWCFALAHNDSPDVKENVTAQITVLDDKGKQAGSQTALLPLDILPAGQSLPLSVYFAPPMPSKVRVQVQPVSAIELLPSDQRYLNAKVQNTQVLVDASGLSAQASGLVLLSADSKPASRVWVAAVAYDGAGNVVGVRRWEASEGIQPGGSLPFSFAIAGIAGGIERVDFAVEARP